MPGVGLNVSSKARESTLIVPVDSRRLRATLSASVSRWISLASCDNLWVVRQYPVMDFLELGHRQLVRDAVLFDFETLTDISVEGFHLESVPIEEPAAVGSLVEQPTFPDSEPEFSRVPQRWLPAVSDGQRRCRPPRFRDSGSVDNFALRSVQSVRV